MSHKAWLRKLTDMVCLEWTQLYFFFLVFFHSGASGGCRFMFCVGRAIGEKGLLAFAIPT